jgi:2-aminoadipate transaminase
MPSDASWSHPEGGYFIWLDVPSCPDTGELLARAEEAGVTFVKGTDFFVPGGGGERSLRLAFSFVSPAEIETGMARLAPLLSGAPAPTASV